MRRPHNQTTQIHECAFEAHIHHTNAAVKFSCKMFVAWKNMSNKTFCKTVNDNVVVKDGVATFNQSLSFQTYLLFDKASEKYLKKQTSLCLLLVSSRKPDQEKLVGRVIVDLAQVLNENVFNQVRDHKLAFCSIANATVTFNIVLIRNTKTDIKPMDLDMDQFSIIQRGLNQSTSSNNDDLLAFKNIGRDVSQQLDTQKQINAPKHTDQQQSQAKVKAKDQHQQNTPKQLTTPKPAEEVSKQESFEKQIIQAKSLTKEPQQQIIEQKVRLDQDKSIEVEKPMKFDIVIQTPKSLTSNINNEDLINLKFNNKKLENQNEKLIQIIDQINTQLSQQKNQNQKWKNKFQNAQRDFHKNLDEKNDVIQQLLSQVQQSSRKCIQLESKIKGSNQSHLQLEKLRQRLNKTVNLFEQSEKFRLDIESQLLQVRFELSELKTDKENLQNQIKMKDEQLDKLYKFTEDIRSSSKHQQQIDRSLYKSLSMLSDRQRTSYNEEIEALKRKMNKLMKQLEFTENVKQKLQLFNKECEELNTEKDNLLSELNNIRQERQLWVNKQQISTQKEDKAAEKLESNIENVENELKEVQNQLDKYESQKFQLSQKIQALQQQNYLIRKILQLKQAELTKANEDINFLQTQKQTMMMNVGQKLKNEETRIIYQEKQKQLQNDLLNLRSELQIVTKQKQQWMNKEKQFYYQLARAQSIKQQLKDRLKQLEINLQSVVEEKAELLIRQNKLQQTLKQMEKEKQKAEALKKQSQTFKQISSSNSQKIFSLKNKQIQLQNQITQYKQQVNRLKEELQKEKKEIQKSDQNNKNMVLTIQKLDKQNKENKNKILSLQQQNDILKQSNNQLKGKMTKAQRQFLMTKQQLSQQRKASKQSVSKNQKVEKSLEDKDAIVKAKDQQIVELKEKLDTEAAKIQQLEDRISRFAEKELKMRENILILQEQSRKIYDIVVDKEQNQQFQSMALEEKENQIQSLRLQLQQKSTLCQIANQQLTQFKKQLYDLKKQAINKRIEHESDEPSPKKPHSAHSADNQNSEKYQQFLKLSNERIKELEQIVSQNEYLKDRQIQNLKVKISILQNQLANEKKRNSNLQQDKNGLRQQRMELHNTIQNLQNSLRIEKIQVSRALEQVEACKQKISKSIHLQQKQVQMNQILNEKDNQIHRLSNQIKLLESQKANKQSISSFQQKQQPNALSNDLELQRRINELMNQNQMMESQLTNQDLTISQFKQQIIKANNTINTLKNQLEESEVEKMNAELQKQFPPAKDKSRSPSEQIKKMGVFTSNMFTQQFIEACKCLQQLLRQRVEKDKTESILEMLVSKNAMMEEQLNKITQQRGLIQQNARKLSMQFQKIKSKILKGKGSYQQKNQLLTSLKPFEIKVKDLVQITERLSDAQLENENF